jgi:AbrB family looped-hinge helix DNA binding protein
MPYVKVLRGGQITMPKPLRQALEIKEGDVLEVEMKNHKVVLKPKALADKEQAWARLKQIMDKVGKRHRKIPEEEVEKDVLEAIKAVRSR